MGLEKDQFALKCLRHKHLLIFASAIMKGKEPKKKGEVIDEIASKAWKEEDWNNENYKYVVPIRNGNKRKQVGEDNRK